MKTVDDNLKHSGTGHLLACVTSSVCGGPNVGVIRLVGSLHSRVALCPPGDPSAGVSVRTCHSPFAPLHTRPDVFFLTRLPVCSGPVSSPGCHFCKMDCVHLGIV